MTLLMPAAKGLHPDTDKLHLRRISVVRDKERKNRPIAIFDYFSQTSLKPLHDAIMAYLAKIPTDLTFNQFGVEQIPSNPNSSYYSLDLTAATDRFPVSLQEKILGCLIGKEKAEA